MPRNHCQTSLLFVLHAFSATPHSPTIAMANRVFLESGFRALTLKGIWVGQMDAIVAVQSPEIDKFARLMGRLERAGFQSLLDYAVQDNAVTKSVIVALKDSDSRAQWFQNEAQFNLALATRLIPSSSANMPLYFDGATMMQYQFTSRIVEEAWCRRRTGRNPIMGNDYKWCQRGHGFSPDLVNIPRSHLSVRPSTVANGGRGVYSTQRIAHGSTVALDEYINCIYAPSTTVHYMDLADETFDETISSFWSTVYVGYLAGYGFEATDYVRDGQEWSTSLIFAITLTCRIRTLTAFWQGPEAIAVEPGIMSFVNHGCNGTYNTGHRFNETEMTMELGRGPQGIALDEFPTYHPRAARHFPFAPHYLTMALQDIEPDTELLDNYLTYGGVKNLEYWDENLRDLKLVCSGGIGSITRYEMPDD
jgi:hypothetical protein